MESLANASANAYDLQDKVQNGQSVNAQDTLDAAMGRKRTPVEDDSEISRVLGDVTSTAKSVQLNTSELENNIENARKPDEEAPGVAPKDDALPTMESKDKKESVRSTRPSWRFCPNVWRECNVRTIRLEHGTHLHPQRITTFP